MIDVFTFRTSNQSRMQSHVQFHVQPRGASLPMAVDLHRRATAKAMTWHLVAWRLVAWLGMSLLAVSPWSAGQLQGADTAPVSLGSTNSVAVAAELKTVKLYGAGGVGGLDSYQSGFFVSEKGYILTVWSTVLDVDTIIAVTSDGVRMEAKVLGIDPNLEIAVLSTDKTVNHYFDLTKAITAETGLRVLAFSNLYKIATGQEMSSIQKGVVMAKTQLDARRGTFQSVYQGPIYVIDAMTNNPGAAGGALTDIRGNLIGMLGKELRDARANTWLNYAIPIEQLKESVERIISGKSILRNTEGRKVADRPMVLGDLGIVLIPDVLAKTPAYVDTVQPNSAASAAGLANDDLILFINSVRITSQSGLRTELKYIDKADSITLLIQRGTTLREVTLSSSN
jgi:serine protease Do